MTRTACLNAIYDLAKEDERVVFIGSDLSPNTMLEFKRDFPNRFFMEGIQEQNIIGMAAGLGLEGFIPYVNTIATFLTRRCYEQIVIDIALHNLPVRLIGNGAGLVYSPLGATHCAIDDIAIMRAIPNMSVICSSDNDEIKAFMSTTLENMSPMYIRLGKDNDPKLRFPEITDKNRPSKNILFISTGRMSDICINTCDILWKKNIHCSFRHRQIIKPLDIGEIPKWIDLIVTAEEGIVNGGFGSAVIEYLADKNMQIPVLRFGLPDAFPSHYGEQEDLLETYGLTPEKMAMRIKGFYDNIK